MARRYFEFSEGTSNKFWEVWIEGGELRTRYGKVGAAGQVTIKDEGSPATAQKLHDRLVREKTGKGYVEKSLEKDADGTWDALTLAVDLPLALEAHLSFLAQTESCKRLLTELCATAKSVRVIGANLEVIFVSPEGGEEWTLTGSPAFTGAFARNVPRSHQALCRVHNTMSLEGSDVPLSFNGVTDEGALRSGGFARGFLAECEPELVATLKEEEEDEVISPIDHHQDWVLYHPLVETNAGEPALCFLSHEGGRLHAPYDRALGIPGVYLRLLADDVLGRTTVTAEAGTPDEREEAGPSRRFENTEEGASKFWQITVDGSSHTVRYGKIGTDGQQKQKQFGDEGAAKADAARLIAEKTGKGYEEV